MKFLNIWILHWFVSLHNLLKEFSSLEEIFWSILKSSSRILSFEAYFLNLKIIKNIQVFTRDKDPQDSSRKCSAWKDFRFKPLSFQFPPRDRVKCGGLGRERVLFLSLVGLVRVCSKFQLPSLSRSGLKVPGGVVVWWWLRPILVFSLSLSQAEQ